MSDILIVDDEQDIRELISDILRDEGYETRMTGTSDGAMSEIRANPPSLLILDIWLKDSDMDGIDILKQVKIQYPQVPVVIISGHGNIEIAVAAIKQGAYDFIEKPFNIDQLLVVISRAMETSRLRKENRDLKSKDQPNFDLVGEGTVFKTFLAQVEKVTNSNARLMLTGPSGCGKEVIARHIHQMSNRADGPFVVLNCASVAADHMEDILYGKVEASGQVQPGLFARAEGGILFFDEVADLPLETQSKLLRVLVDQTYTPVGATEKRKADFRIISSSAKNLKHAIAEKTFREELFHRLSVIPLEVPSLEERREDIPDLADYFVARLSEAQGYEKREFSSEAVTVLQAMKWPGNIRQLKNLVERVLSMGTGRGEIDPSEFPSEDGLDHVAQSSALNGRLVTLPLREAREEFEREYLITQINRFGRNISKTANFVGMERSALHRKLKSLGISTSGRLTETE